MGSSGFQDAGYMEDGAEAETWASHFSSSAVPIASKGWCLKWIAHGDALYSSGNSKLGSTFCSNLVGERIWKRMDTCICKQRNKISNRKNPKTEKGSGDNEMGYCKP